LKTIPSPTLHRSGNRVQVNRQPAIVELGVKAETTENRRIDYKSPWDLVIVELDDGAAGQVDALIPPPVALHEGIEGVFVEEGDSPVREDEILRHGHAAAGTLAHQVSDHVRQGRGRGDRIRRRELGRSRRHPASCLEMVETRAFVT
jgi:hypothetical protein